MTGVKKTIKNLHKDHWSKQFHRAKGKGLLRDYENDYTQVPGGRVWELKDKGFVVTVGTWINKYPEVKKLILYEFDLPDSTEFKIELHWNIGSGWSGDRI